jgi:hypothetical protein
MQQVTAKNIPQQSKFSSKGPVPYLLRLTVATTIGERGGGDPVFVVIVPG